MEELELAVDRMMVVKGGELNLFWLVMTTLDSHL